MPSLGLLGYPNTGKTTLFNALTGLSAPTAPHPFTTTEPNVGVAEVPDDKLEEVARLEGSAKVVHTTLELIDLPPRGHHGGGLAGAYLGRLREVEALIVVLRAFDDPSVPDGSSGFDPTAQAEELSLEMVVADSEQFERRRERLAKEATADPTKRLEAAAIAEADDVLSAGTLLRSRHWEEGALRFFREAAPLTLKPIVWVVNVNEDEADAAARVAALSSVVAATDTVMVLSAKIEEEGARLSTADRRELFDGLGLGEGALAMMVRAVHAALGLISFYTLGSKEAHAWTVRRGTTAVEAAGRIHSDFERGFIRAEVSTVDQVIEAGGWDRARHTGKVRVEGRSYVIQDREVMLVRFSV